MKVPKFMKNAKYLKFVKITKNSGMGFVKYIEIMDNSIENFFKASFFEGLLKSKLDFFMEVFKDHNLLY